MTQRVVEGKSVVDMTVAVCCCQEHYDKKIDSFLLFSSDSDYWPLINNVVTARFLMMIEKEKTSKAIVNKMREHRVPYCYTDQFCKAGDTYRLRNDALALECASYLKQHLGSCNIEDMLQSAYDQTRIELTDKEKEMFRKEMLNRLRIVSDEGGNLSIAIENQ